MKMMRLSSLASIGILMLALASRTDGSVLLNQGDTFLFSFNNLSFNSTLLAPPGFVPFARFELEGVSFLDSGDRFRFELFENAIDETPLFIGTEVNSFAQLPNAWADRQGAVLFTMLDGSMSLDRFRISSMFAPGPDGTTVFVFAQRFEPVPEPSIAALGVVALVFGFALRKFKGQ